MTLGRYSITSLLHSNKIDREIEISEGSIVQNEGYE